MLSAILERPEHLVLPHVLPSAAWADTPEQPSRADAVLRVARRRQVIHPVWGIGRVLHSTATSTTLTVQFRDVVREVPRDTLRCVLPLTELAALVEETSQITAWTVRKAHDQGAIQPDAIGHLAGHRVHYYDVARVPGLIRELLERDDWSIGTLVIHPRRGVGKISGYVPQPEVRGSAHRCLRAVEFFGSSGVVSLPTQELRRLIPGHALAKRVGSDRRAFGRLAAARGIYPDYIAPHGRVREFYDETRIEAIASGWTRPVGGDSWRPGSIILNAEGEVGTIINRDARGQVHLRSVQPRAPIESTNVRKLQELVSLRELARRQNVSRYKLQRLLAAVSIKPVHQQGKTLYFDRVRAEQALRARLDSERQAVTLGVLASRIGVSEPVLGRKVREGCIRTLGHHSVHYIAAAEADRIQQVVRALRSRSHSIESLGICRLHTRGRTGHEVAAWDIGALVQVAQSLSPDRKSILFGQVAWLSEGAGRKRLRAAFDDYVASIHATNDEGQARRAAKCLLQLTDSLTSDFSRYRVRLLLLASGARQSYSVIEQRIRKLATQSGCENKRTYDRFRSHIDQRLLEVLEHERDLLASAGSKSGEDETRGVVLIVVSDGKPELGVVTAIERQCWDALLGCWHKTTVVRFADGDRRIRLRVRHALNELPPRAEQPLVLLQNAEAMELTRLLQQRCPYNFSSDEILKRDLLQKAS